MFTARIPSQKIDRPRIDPEFYSPEKLEALGWRHKWLDRLVTLEHLSSRITDGTHITPDYITEGVHFLSSTNINCCSVDFQRTQFISKYAYEEFAKSNCNPEHGDLLIAKNGKIGTAAQYLQSHPPCSLFVSVALIRKPEGIDRDYLAVFLNSKGGWSQFSRASKTGVITNLHLEEIREVEVVQCAPIVQKYIGDKVRQAERMRVFAGEMEASFKISVLDEFPAINEHAVGNVRHNRAIPREIESNLNPGNFNPDRVKIRSYLKSNGGLKVAVNAEVETPTTSSYSPHDRYIGLDAIGSATGTINASTIGNEDVVGTVRLLSEGPVISKLRPYLNKVAYIPSEFAGSCGSTELLCVRGKSPELNWYLCGVLSLQSTVRQLVPVSTGSTHPRVTREDVLDVLIPWIKTPELAGNKLALAQRAYFMSDRLISLAKLLVEALIERKVAEDELVHAQTGFENGDDSADRAILSRLFEGGWDATETRPLFPDLDAYYKTLRMVEREQTEGAAK
jgi:type I restriction enzyme S subunit